MIGPACSWTVAAERHRLRQASTPERGERCGCRCGISDRRGARGRNAWVAVGRLRDQRPRRRFAGPAHVGERKNSRAGATRDKTND